MGGEASSFLISKLVDVSHALPMFQIDRAILFLSIDHVIRVGDYIGVVVLPAGAGIHVSDVAECYGNHLRVQWNLERIGDRAGQSRLELGVALGVAFDLIRFLMGVYFWFFEFNATIS